MPKENQIKLFKNFLNYHWLRPEVALIKYYQANEWRKWNFREPSMDLLCGDGEFAFLTWDGRFDALTDMYMNVPAVGVEDYFTNRDVYDIPFKKREYKITKKATIKITTGFDYSKGQINKAKRLDLYREFIVGDIDRDLKNIADNTYASIFTNSLNAAEKTESTLAELYRILRVGGRLFLSIQDKMQAGNALYHLYEKKGLMIGKYLDRGIYDNLANATYEIDYFKRLVRKSGFKNTYCRPYGPAVIFKIYQIGFRSMFPSFIEMYRSLSKNGFKTVKKKWTDNVFFILKEMLDSDKAEKMGKESFWHFIVLEK